MNQTNFSVLQIFSKYLMDLFEFCISSMRQVFEIKHELITAIEGDFFYLCLTADF